MKSIFATVLAALALATVAPAWAGRACTAPQPPKTATIERALNLAERTLRALDQSGADVVVLARAGQDLSRYGLRYSHLGFAYRQRDAQVRLGRVFSALPAHERVCRRTCPPSPDPSRRAIRPRLPPRMRCSTI